MEMFQRLQAWKLKEADTRQQSSLGVLVSCPEKNDEAHFGKGNSGTAEKTMHEIRNERMMQLSTCGRGDSSSPFGVLESGSEAVIRLGDQRGRGKR
ncbi:hypothetical protein BJX63DRAFT_279011 [Aspergillus granulosus]|uniref:Uncharacterized protein n=1 Tax=Aspergillus granulosus TaxID=176169 RepID=A0ABR4HYN1_9EURO